MVDMFGIMVSPGQMKELDRLLFADNHEEWWERLADITEVDPEWLLDKITQKSKQHFITKARFRKAPYPADLEEAEKSGSTLVYFIKSPHRHSGRIRKWRTRCSVSSRSRP